jgi:hypothetical protein
VLENSWNQAAPCAEVWEAKIVEGRPIVRMLIGHQWWELHLHNAHWSRGRRAAFESVASGVAGGELFLYRVPADDRYAHSKIRCRIVAWLPRKQVTDTKESQDTLPDRVSQLDLAGRRLEDVNIQDLRAAIRANLVSFPSQVPTFQKHARPDLLQRIAQLYFVLGWDCSNIGARYELSRSRVRLILNSWKRRAAKAGYIQHIPPSEMMSELAMVKEIRKADETLR